MNLFSSAVARQAMLNQTSGKLLVTAGYYCAFIAIGLVLTSLSPTLLGLSRQTQSSLSEVSILFTTRSMGFLLTALLGSRLYDRFPGHPLLIGALVLVALTMALVPLVPLLWLLASLFLFMGIVEGMIDVGGNTLIVWLHRDKVGPFMNGMHFAFGVGAFIAPIIISQSLLYSGGIAWGYWMIALLILPVALLFFWLPSPIPERLADGVMAPPAQTALVGLIALFFFLYVGIEASFGGWIATYAVTLGLAPEATAGYLTSAFWVALTIGRLLSVPIATRLRPRTILLSDLLGGLASLILLLLWPTSLTVIWIGALGLGLSIASAFPTTLALAERNMTVTGGTTGWFFVGASLGGMSIPWLVGQLFESISPFAFLWTVGLVLVLAIGVYMAMMAWINRGVRPG